VRLAPDRLGAHRRDGRKFDESFRFGVREEPSDPCYGVETCDEEVRRALGAGVILHEGVIFARLSDDPAYGVESRVQMFSTRRATCGSPRDAAKLSAPAAKTFAPDAAS